MMKERRTVRSLLSLLCCMAMLLSCVPVTLAAGGVVLDDDFESYTSQADLGAVWTENGSTEINFPQISTKRAFSGKQSLVLEDTETDKSAQTRTRVTTTQPEGTEFIMSTRYFVESVGGSGLPWIQLYTATGKTLVNTYSTGKWDSLSAIYTSGADKQTLYAFMGSNSTTLSKVYWDDVKVQVLTQELALQYIDEKLAISGTPDLAAALTSKALSLDGVDEARATSYGRNMKQARAAKGSALTRAEVQACVDKGNSGDMGPLFEDDFESYATAADLTSVWSETGSSEKPLELGTDRAHSGKQSLLLDDTQTDKSVQARAKVPTIGPAGTEYIFTTKYFVESLSGSSNPYIRLYTADGYTTIYTYSTGKWDSLSTILATQQDRQTMYIFMGSNTAPESKVYYDDITVQELTEELAVDYINEKALISGVPADDMLAGLKTRALSLTGVNDEAKMKYVEELQAARKTKNALLTRAEIQACVDNANMSDLAGRLSGGSLSVGEAGDISAQVTALPDGVSAQWVSVSPANKNITVSGGKATAKAIPTGADDVYSAVLRLTTAGRSTDVNYTIRLVNTAGFNAEVVNKARQELAADTVIGVSATGTVARPKVEADGVTVQWSAIKSNPGSRLSLSGGNLKVNSLPSGFDYAEGVVTLKLTKGDASAALDYTVIVYDDTYHVLMDLPNASLEAVGEDGLPLHWKASALATESAFVELAQGQARTGTNSVRVVDTGVTPSIGVRTALDAVSAKVGYDYVATVWAKGSATADTADRAGASIYVEFNTDAASRKKAYAGPATPINSSTWTQLTMRGEATAAYVDVMGYSYQATVSDMYFDDFLLWEITPAGILAEIDAAITSGDAPTLYERLGSGTLNVSGLAAANKTAYLTALTAKRAAKGSALTGTELADGVKTANTNVDAADKALVTKLAGQVKTSQILTQAGAIPLPNVGDSSVTLKWSKVSGAGAGRIRLTGVGAVLDSLPAFGSQNESATLTLTITKGSASAMVDVNTTLKAYTKNMSDMVAAAGTLDITDYLNGQNANYVTSDLKALPSSLSGGISVTWQALDSATLEPISAVSARGKVTRPAYGAYDAAVTLRATLTKGGESYTHDAYLIVAALGADEARAVVTENVDFEAEAPLDEYTAPTGWNKRLKWADGKNEVLTSYANIDRNTAFTGKQAMRITADGKMASVQNEHVFTAREGFTYTLEVMACTGDTTAPSVTLKFWDNEGTVLTSTAVKYADAPGGRGVWKNLSVRAVAPVGTVQVTAELDGGTKAGVTWFDDVRLREYPIVSNGSFDLGTAGWTTSGTVSGGKLTLTRGQTAVSLTRAADRGVAYFLSLTADGGKAALRFVDAQGKTLAEYSKAMQSGSNAFYAYAPEHTAGVQVVLTGAMTADDVKITRSASGTGVADGDFEFSASAGMGTPWDLTNASIAANTGRSGAGLTVKSGGKAVSSVIPVMDGKSYTFTADVKGKGTMSIGLYTIGNTGALQTSRTVTSAGDDWNTITYSFDQLPEAVGSGITEHTYARITLTGEAVFDNVKAYSVTKTVANPSMENLNTGASGSFPINWTGYGPAATYVANQDGQFTEGVKGLGVELFGLGQGGVRSSMIKDAKGGRAYEAAINAKGSGARLSVEFWDKDFSKLGSEFVTINSAEFKEYAVKGTAPTGTTYVSLSVGGEGTGSVVVDQATLYPVVRAVGTDVQLFLDNWLIADSTNVKRTFREGEKLDLIFSGGWYPQVQWDEKDQLYKMWYQISGYYMNLRTSKDGVNWSAATPCYLNTGEKIRGSSVHIDEDETDPNKRYKAICFNHVQNLTEGSYDLYVSPDGITWTFEAKGLRGQDVVTVAYDPVYDEYITTYKISIPAQGTKRTHSTAVSKDLKNWTEGVRMYTVGVQADCGDDFLRIDGYGTGMYPLGGSYVALDWRFMLDDADNFGGLMDSVLLFSRDLTEDWQRMYDENGKQVVGIPRGKDGEWDDAQTYSADSAINIGDETWWYYAGWSGDHGTVGVPKTPGISAVKWRKNGFASLDFAANGTMTTEQFTLTGDKLHLNAKGELTVELLDAKGAVAATGKFSGDSVDSVITWDKSVAGQLGKVVSLRFSGSNAELYTLQFEGSIFSDVTSDAWYRNAVHYAVENGIMGGYGGGKFGPDDTLSRAMVVQVLYNKEGQPAISGKHAFSDVPADQWFNNAVTWGTRNGVMAGYGGGKFGPNDPVTIEQIAVILWNYSGNPKFKGAAEGVGKYSGWAANGLAWAVENGILHGVPFQNATENATRAQTAQILMNYLRK